MPGKVKVKILACRNLPVMDRGSDTTDAYVEIKLGNITQKTDVKRKSLHPIFNTDWFRFELDDAELQDEPLQVRIMDYDTYSANDQIGKVCINLNPLLLSNSDKGGPVTHTGKGSVMSGWLPVYDTMLGIRGEVNLIVKVDLFSDVNKFRQSSCGVQFFHSPNIPFGYHAQIIHGFVEELVVNDDPEYQWIDKIRRASTSNEARQVAFLKLSGQVQRKIGLKAIDLGANAVIGYTQCFDLEGEMIVVRGIGTAVTLVKIYDLQALNQNMSAADALLEEKRMRYYEFMACGNQKMLETILEKARSRVEEPLVFNEILADSDPNSSNKNLKFLLEQEENKEEQKNKKLKGIKVLQKLNPFYSTKEEGSRYRSLTDLRNFIRRKSSGATSKFLRSKSDGSTIKTAVLASSISDASFIKKKKEQKKVGFHDTHKTYDSSLLCLPLMEKDVSVSNISTVTNTELSSSSSESGDDEDDDDDDIESESFCAKLDPETVSMVIKNVLRAEEEKQEKLTTVAPLVALPEIKAVSGDEKFRFPVKKPRESSESPKKNSGKLDSSEPARNLGAIPKVPAKGDTGGPQNAEKQEDSKKDPEVPSKFSQIDLKVLQDPEVPQKIPENPKVPQKIPENPKVPQKISENPEVPEKLSGNSESTKETPKNQAKPSEASQEHLIGHPEHPKHKHDFMHDLKHKISGKLHYLHDHIHLPHFKHHDNGKVKHHKQPGLLETALESILLDKVNIMEAHSGIAPKNESEENLEHLEKAGIEEADKIHELKESMTEKIHHIQEHIHMPHLPDAHDLKEKIHHLQEHIHLPHFPLHHEVKKEQPMEQKRSNSESNLILRDESFSPLKSIKSAEYFIDQDPTDWRDKKSASQDFDFIKMKIDREDSNPRKIVVEEGRAYLEHLLVDFKKETFVRVNTLPDLEAQGRPTSPIETFLQSKCLSLDSEKPPNPFFDPIDPKCLNEMTRVEIKIEDSDGESLAQELEVSQDSKKNVEKFAENSEKTRKIAESAETFVGSGKFQENSESISEKSVKFQENAEKTAEISLKEIERKSEIERRIMGKPIRGFRLQKLSEISQQLSNEEEDDDESDEYSIPAEVQEVVLRKSEYEPKSDLKPTTVLEETIRISSANQIKISVLRTPSFKRKSFSDDDLVSSDKKLSRNNNDNSNLSVTNKLPLHESLLSLKHRNELSASPSGVNRVHSRTESIGNKFSQSPAKLSGTPGSLTGRDIIYRRSSDSDLSITPKGNSLTDRTTGVAGYVRVRDYRGALMKQPFNQENLEMLEYPFLTINKFPHGFIVHIGATVAARSVKLLERVPNPDEPEARDSWWNELRMEIRSHCRSLGCNVVLGYRESTTISDDVCVLSATGTACVINLQFTTDFPSNDESGQKIIKTQTTTIYNKDLMTSSLDRQEFEPSVGPKVSTVEAPKVETEAAESNGNEIPGKGKNTPEPMNNSAGSNAGVGGASAPHSLCSITHVPYKASSLLPIQLRKCNICKRGLVSDVLICSIEMPEGLQVTGRGCLIQANVCRPKRDLKSESNAKEISDQLPFLEYELHRLLINKLKVKGMNAIFGLKAKVTVGEKMMALIATGTAVYLSALPNPKVPKVVAGNSWNDPEKLAEIQRNIQETVEKNREVYQLKNYQVELELNGNKSKYSDTEDSDEENESLDYTVGNKEMCLLEVDDIEDLEVVSMLMENCPPEGFHVVNTQSVPGLHDLEIVRNLQMFTQVWRAKVQTHQANSNFSKHFQRLLQTIYFKLRTLIPCAIVDLSFQLDLPENDEIQLLVTGMALGLGEPQKANKFKRKIVHSISRDKKLDDDLIFSLEEDNIGETKEEQAQVQTNPHVSASGAPLSNITSPHFNQSGSLKHRRNTPTRTRFNSMKNRHTPINDRYGVDLSVLSYVAGGKIEKYLGNLNFFFIRESTSVRENGGICGFVHSFITELLAIVRAHITALGGNAMISFYMTELILVDNPHKNQAQCLVNVGGDAVFVTYFNDDG